jgi:hypothetical protein
MSILDDAIREHLELKRAHGADAAELKRLEDEAFGPPGRPDEGDSLSEARTEFLAAPATGAAEAAADAKAEPGGRAAPNITDLQEAPQAPRPETAGEEEPSSAEHQTIPVPRPEDGPDAEDEEAAPEAPAAEDSTPKTPTGPSTEERHAIASQPTEFFDVGAEIGAGSEQQSPTDEELLDSKLSEPRLAPAEPATPTEPAAPAEPTESTGPDAEVAGDPLTEDEDEDEFFSEQRLSDELNQALEAPVTDEQEALPEPPSEEHTEVYDFGSERREEHDEEDDFEDEEHDERPSSEPEDVLEDTPEFLEDAPEDDELWFEQKPPKDFDFDD